MVSKGAGTTVRSSRRTCTLEWPYYQKHHAVHQIINTETYRNLLVAVVYSRQSMRHVGYQIEERSKLARVALT